MHDILAAFELLVLMAPTRLSCMRLGSCGAPHSVGAGGRRRGGAGLRGHPRHPGGLPQRCTGFGRCCHGRCIVMQMSANCDSKCRDATSRAATKFVVRMCRCGHRCAQGGEDAGQDAHAGGRRLGLCTQDAAGTRGSRQRWSVPHVLHAAQQMARLSTQVEFGCRLTSSSVAYGALCMCDLKRRSMQMQAASCMPLA
jgi:hypothetical protein